MNYHFVDVFNSNVNVSNVFALSTIEDLSSSLRRLDISCSECGKSIEWAREAFYTRNMLRRVINDY